MDINSSISEFKKNIDESQPVPLEKKLLEEQEAIHKSDEARTHADGWKEFYKLRSIWSWFILGCIAILIIFQITLTVLIGTDKLHYLKEQYNWFIPLVTAENFIQIIGLALILVKFLFKNHIPK